MSCGQGNVYQVHTLIQLSVTFYNTLLNVPADPVTAALFVEDPTGTVTQVPANLITRSGVGAYSSQYLPAGPGQYFYKWQGSGVTGVQATSPDGAFFVEASEVIA